MTVQGLHRIVGVSTFVVFLATGVFMRWQFPDLYGGNEVIRFLFRANHVYLLFAGLLNSMAGLLSSLPAVPWRRSFCVAGSFLLMLSSPLFLAAFVVEPLQASAMRPLTIVAAFSGLVGVLLHSVALWKTTEGT